MTLSAKPAIQCLSDELVTIPIGDDFKKKADEALANLKTFDPVFNGLTLEDVASFGRGRLMDGMFERIIASVIRKRCHSRKRAVETFAEYRGKSMSQARKMIPPRKVNR